MDRQEISAAAASVVLGNDENTMALKESIGSVAGLSPDFEADIQGVSSRTGVPLETVRSMPDEAKKKEFFSSVDFGELSSQFPRTAAFLSDPKNAAVASDDIGIIKSIESGWKAFVGGIKKGGAQEELADLHYKDMMEGLSPQETARRDEIKGEMGKADLAAKEDPSKTNYFLNQTGYTGRQVITSMKEGGKGAAVGSTAAMGTALLLGQLGPQAAVPEELLTVPSAAMLGGRTGFIAGSVIYNYKAEAGFAWDEFKEIKDRSGKSMDPTVARIAAEGVGLMNAGLETLGEVAMIRLFPGFDKMLAMGPKAAVREMLKKQTFRDSLMTMVRGGKSILKSASIEGITEALQELSAVIGGETAKMASDGDFERASFGESAQRIAETGRDAFVGSVGVGGLGAASNRLYSSIRERAEQKRAETNADFIRALGDTSKDSKLLERLPERYKEFIKKLKEGGPIQNIFIPSDQFVSYFQSKGLDPAEVAAQTGVKNYGEAVAAGTDVVIPVEDYASTLAKTEHHAGLSKDIRLHQEDDTLREHEEKQAIKQELEKNLKEMADQGPVEEGADAANQIKSEFADKLIGAGYDTAAANAYAASYAKAITTIAARAGIDPIELSNKYGLTVRRPMSDLPERASVDTSVDPLIDMLRNDRIPSKQEIHGKSLLEFVKERGGIRPDALTGELRWLDDGKKGFARISNKNSQYGVDEMASLAAESGYNVAGPDGQVTEASFIDALSAGDDTFSNDNTDYGLLELKGQLEELRSFLSRAGIDLSQVGDNAVVRKLMEQTIGKEAQDASNPLFQFVGRKAIGASESKLREAARMQKSGADMESIRKSTGWFMGPDNRWRYEISDEKSKIIPVKLGKVKTFNLDQVLKHDELFAAYPHLKNITVAIRTARDGSTTGGTWDRANNKITIYLKKSSEKTEHTNEDGEKFILEEVDAEIERLKGSPEYKALEDGYFSIRKDARLARWAKFKKTEVGARYRKLEDAKRLYFPETVAQKTLPESVKDTLLHEVQHAVQSTEGFNPGSSSNGSAKDYQRYLSTLGEIESRNVEERKDMTAEQRASESPSILTWKNPVISWGRVTKELPIEDVPLEVMPTDMTKAVQLTLFQGDGKDTNSNGEPIAKDKESTDRFWKWFEGSTLVDNKGRPMVFYHGSTEEGIESFSNQKTSYGFFFTPDRQTAEFYTGGDGGSVYSVYLNVKNLADFDDPEVFDKVAREAIFDLNETRDEDSVREFAASLYRDLYSTNETVKKFFDSQPGFNEVGADYSIEDLISDNQIDSRDIDPLVKSIGIEKVSNDYEEFAPAKSKELELAREAYGSQDFYMNYQNDFLQAAESMGYDGVVLTDPSSTGESISYVVFKSEQIKATNNNGGFDDTGSILYQDENKVDQKDTPQFKRWSNDAPFVSSKAAESREFKTGEKVVLEGYHGTARPDRVGSTFLKKRATSGPMAFFTSSPELGSGYAQSKRDTSVDYEDNDYKTWFQFSVPGSRSRVDIVRSWHFLDAQTKARISEMAPKLRISDDANSVVVEEGNTRGNGSYDYNLEQSGRGQFGKNPLAALVEDWLNSGNLFDNEYLFMEVLNKAGYPTARVKYSSPFSSSPAVYKVFVKMQNPLVTSDVPKEVMESLIEAAKKDRSRPKVAQGADIWDKNTRTLKEWVAHLTDPKNERVAYVWTSIPDKVTSHLKSLGYDGIIDYSGKGGGSIVAPVYIPFAPNQVKSAIGNSGEFGDGPNILYQSAPVAPPTYSRLIQTVEQKMGETASKQQVEGMIRDIKEEERKWLGIDEFLSGKERVSKKELLDFLQMNDLKIEDVTYSGEKAENSAFKKYTLGGGENYREVLFKWKPKESEARKRAKPIEKDFLSSHWNETNVLAHVRLVDRVDADGKRVLFVEEIQSDWHQLGRKYGYFGINEVPNINEIYDRNGKPGKVPSGPLQKTWHEYAFKRIIRMAADGGYDRVSWTTGEQQAARYDLSKQISRIEYEPSEENANGESLYELSVYDKKDENIIHKYDLSINRVEAVVGKEMAQKIKAKEGRSLKSERPLRDWMSLDGLDLKVGGEGMKGFYDKMLVEYADKLGKKYGAKVFDSKIKLEMGQLDFEDGDMDSITDDEREEIEGEAVEPDSELISASKLNNPEMFGQESVEVYGFQEQGSGLGTDEFGGRDAGEGLVFYEANISGERVTLSSPASSRLSYAEAMKTLNKILADGMPKDSGLTVHSIEITKELRDSAVTEGFQLFQPAFHGSPHRFEKFSLNHIGSGEGAQTYGWGLYFAESQIVAKTYRAGAGLLTPRVFFPSLSEEENDLIPDWLARNIHEFGEAGLDKQIAEFESRKREDEELLKKKDVFMPWITEHGVHHLSSVLSALKKLKESGDPKGQESGSLFAVDIPDESAEKMLLWDKPMSQQPESVRSALENRPEIKAKEVDPDGLDIGGGTIRDNRNGQYKPESTAPWVLVTGDSVLDLSQADVDAMVGDSGDPDGEKIYKDLSVSLGGQKQASEFLGKLGIPGIKYLDGGSRANGFGTHNFVVWDQQTIDKINESVERSMYQSGEDKRGYIQIGKDRKISITLLEKADLSTMLHELGHFYLEVLGDIVREPGASEQIRSDYETLMKWMGVSSRDQIGVEQHEMFARAHEAYLLEGMAPSEELRGVFQRFKDWLKFIYKQITALNVNLTDEVRGVFDRIYAADDEIEAAKSGVPVDALFVTPEEAGLTPAEFELYKKDVQSQVDQAKEKLLSRLMREKMREHNDVWREERDRLKEEIKTKLSAQPEYVATKALKSGKLEDGTAIKLDKRALVNKYGVDFVKRIPAYAMAKEGMHPDAAAEYLGFESGDSLVEAVISVKDRPIEKVVKEQTDAEMRARHGDMLLDGSVQDEARQALHTSAREKVILLELRAIRKKMAEVKPYVDAKMGEQRKAAKSASDTPPLEMFRAAAKERVESMPLKDVHPSIYLRAQRRYAKLAFDSMAKGDFAVAKDAKEKELLNHHLYLEATKALKASDKIFDYLKKFNERKTREKIGKAQGGYLEQIDALIDRFEFRRVPVSRMKERMALALWIKEQESQGLEPAISESLMDESKKVNYKMASIGDLYALRDSVRNIEHLAKLKNKLILKNEEANFEDAVSDLVNSAVTHGGASKIPVDKNARKMSERFRDKVSAIDATLIKMEQMVEWLDGGDVSGPWHKYFWNPIAQAQFREHDLAKKITQKIVDSLHAMPKEQRVSMLDIYDVPGIGQVTKKYILSIAFNMGNQENIDKMMRGHSWSMEVIEGALRNLNAADWQFVQETWDTINSLWPEIAALEKKMTGLVPPKVEAKPYVAKDKNGLVVAELRGGYYPLVYDPTHSEQGAKQESGDISQMFEAGYVRATTPKGHTKARVNFAAPLMLDFEHVVTAHLTKVIKDLTHREAIIGANKIVTNKEIRHTLQTTLGVEYEKQFLPWLRSVVNDRSSASLQGVGAFVGLPMKLRANVVAYTMGFKATTAIAQIVGLSNSLDKVKARYLARALTDFLKAPVRVTREVKELSGEMRYRAETMDRDIRGRLNQLINDDSSWAQVQKFAFHGIALADSIVAIPTWLGAYRQAVDAGMSVEDAISEADAAVRMTQGSGGAKDLSAVQRGNEMTKMLTMFYSYFNVLYNRMRDMGREVQEIRDMPRFLSRVFFTVAIPAVMGELIVGRGPDDDEDPAEWVIRKTLVYPTLSVPILRDITSSMESGFDYRFTPISMGLDRISKLSHDAGRLYDGDLSWQEFSVKAADTLAIVGGMPGGAQAMSTGKYLWRVSSGQEKPDSLAELIGYAAVGKKASK